MNQNILIIPHYNNNKGLIDSINSIGETEKLDILIIDDGSEKSKINESSILKHKKFNGNIIFQYFDRNQGIEHVLNFGLNYALEKKYTYISRLDCGDLCHPSRFKIQQSFLENNLEIGIVGSYVDAIDTNGHFLYTIKLPQDNKSIKKGMLKNAMFIHPSIMIKSEVIYKCGLYPTAYKAAEDFALFTNILKKYKGYNINQSLVNIEINEKGISIKNRKIQIKSRIKILQENYKLGFYSSYGLIRSYILYYLPYNLIESIKKLYYK